MINTLKTLVDCEVTRSIEKHGSLKSRHEAYAVILEEFQEALDDMETVDDAISCFWACVKKDEKSTGEIEAIGAAALHAAMELIQVAAMARKINAQGLD